MLQRIAHEAALGAMCFVLSYGNVCIGKRGGAAGACAEQREITTRPGVVGDAGGPARSCKLCTQHY
jgi:hypothetical protein